MPDEIAALRAKIDEVDDQILFALSERVKVCKAIGLAKKKQKMPIRDESRENEIYLRVKEKSKKLGLNETQIELLYREIVNICSAVQK
ncbi:MAG TPA: chorismate mutase [Candidatus Deferrimicrobiaceae bacterium]|nr:chorismate mutase [Candidatus Deferrimicrobiaceae bacterium]